MIRLVLLVFVLGVEGRENKFKFYTGRELVNCDNRTDDSDQGGRDAVQLQGNCSHLQQPSSFGNEMISGRKKKKKDTFYEILPMLIIPYLVQSGLLPMMLMSLKFMLIKTLFVGKLALILIALNAFRTRYDNESSMQHLMVKHYGYNGGDEYGAYVNN